MIDYKKHYEKYKDRYKGKYLETRRRGQAALRARRRKVVYDIKIKMCCNRCGFSNPLALDFHHKDPTKKKFNVGAFLIKPTAEVLLEIEKCEVLCSNCHRIHHKSQQNTWPPQSLPSAPSITQNVQ